jgi:hypothetical protein
MFRRKQQQPESMPKDDYTPLVQSLLDEVNRLQREEYRQLRASQRSSESLVILDHRKSEILRTLIHEIGVTPVIGDGGLWKLY